MLLGNLGVLTRGSLDDGRGKVSAQTSLEMDGLSSTVNLTGSSRIVQAQTRSGDW